MLVNLKTHPHIGVHHILERRDHIFEFEFGPERANFSSDEFKRRPYKEANLASHWRSIIESIFRKEDETCSLTFFWYLYFPLY
jgi:hypothetical protein